MDKTQWPTVKFGDVVRQVKDKVDAKESGLERYIAGEHMDSDDLRIRRWGEIGDDYLGPAFHMRFRPGQVLYGSRRTYLRKVAVPDFEGICANTTFVLESKDPMVLLPELLPFVMSTEAFHEHSIKQSKGSVNPYVNFSDLAWYEFALPPLEEQRRIASLLQATENVLENLQIANSKLAGLRTAIVEDAISKIHRKVRFGDLLLDASYGSSKRANNDKSGVPILRIPNVLREEIDLSDLKWVKLSADDIERYSVRHGDILIVRTNGNPEYVGRCVVAHNPIQPMVYASYLIRLRVNGEMAYSDYVSTVLNTPSLRRQIRASVRSSAGNYNLNTQGIRRQQIPLPILSEQKDLLLNVRSK